MSFASDVKIEIAHAMPGAQCCASAELAGFIRSCGSVSLAGRSGFGLRMATEHAAVARHIKSLASKYFGADLSLMVRERAIGRGLHVYELVMPPGAKAEKLLLATGILMQTGSGKDMRLTLAPAAPAVDSPLLRKKCCRKSCLKGLFLGSGTMSNPEKSYNMEFAMSGEQGAAFVRRLINSFEGLHAKSRPRRGSVAVYVSESEQIKDILSIIGAHGQVLKYENVRVLKDVRNRTNRLNNCDAANFDRSSAAAEAQLNIIEELRRAGQLDELDGRLLDTALLRAGHPDASMAELGALHDPPISKAAVAARFRKIASVGDGN